MAVRMSSLLRAQAQISELSRMAGVTKRKKGFSVVAPIMMTRLLSIELKKVLPVLSEAVNHPVGAPVAGKFCFFSISPGRFLLSTVALRSKGELGCAGDSRGDRGFANAGWPVEGIIEDRRLKPAHATDD